MSMIGQSRVVIALCVLLLPQSLLASDASKATNRMSGRHFVFNCDNNDYDYYAPPGSAQAWMRGMYRMIVSAGADVFVADVALPDVVETKDTPSREIIGARLPDALRKDSRRYRTIAELSAQCTDTLHLACDEGHRGGALVLAGMRMSDAHHGTEWKPASDVELFGKFIMDHPEWCNIWPDGRKDATLNYAIPEVRAHRLAILRELAMNYNIDGIELNWMRWCRHFPAGKQREHLSVMTEFVRQVRNMLDEVSRIKGVDRMVLGHRVAPTMDENLNIGCDVPTWMKNGCADFVSSMDFLLTDLNIRTDEYAEAAKGTGCLVYPTITTKYSIRRMYDDNNLYEGKPDNHRAVMMRSLDQVRAVACNSFAWGADGGSCFNMYMWVDGEVGFYKRMIAILSDPKLATQGPRHYIFLPVWQGESPTGRQYNTQSLTFGPDTMGKRQTYLFRMADDRGGEKLKGTLQFRFYNAADKDAFKIDLNGKPLPMPDFQVEYQPNGEVSEEPQGEGYLPFSPTAPDIWKKGTPFKWQANLRFQIDLAKCPSFKGDNELGITLVKELPPSDQSPVMEAVEVKVQEEKGGWVYDLGQCNNPHDLGPCLCRVSQSTAASAIARHTRQRHAAARQDAVDDAG